jgi:hypothetical protein
MLNGDGNLSTSKSAWSARACLAIFLSKSPGRAMHSFSLARGPTSPLASLTFNPRHSFTLSGSASRTANVFVPIGTSLPHELVEALIAASRPNHPAEVFARRTYPAGSGGATVHHVFACTVRATRSSIAGTCSSTLISIAGSVGSESRCRYISSSSYLLVEEPGRSAASPQRKRRTT